MAIANGDGSIIITTKLDVTPVSNALNALRSKFASLKAQRSAIQALTTAIKDQQFVIKQLEMEYAMLIAKGQGNSAQAGELKTRLTALKSELTQLSGAASAMGVKTAGAFTKAAQGLKQFGKRLAGIIKSALIFSMLYRVMQKIVDVFKGILMSDEEFRQDWEELKAAFYTAAYPIINLIVPAVKWIVGLVRDWAVSIGKVAAALQGMSYSELVDQAQASKEAADNYNDMEKSSKKTAENVKKELAAFDDIQILSSGSSGGEEEDEDKEKYKGFEGLKEYDTSGEKTMLEDLTTALAGLLVAIGIILLFCGQVGLGIGFIIAGVAVGAFGVVAATLTDENVSQETKDKLSKALLIVGVIAILLGILLCIAQNWALGIGLIVLGAASVVTPIVANWDSISSKITEIFNNIIEWIKSNAMLIIGIILTLVGMIPLGIALIVESVRAKKSGEEPSWDLLVEKVKEVWEKIKDFWDKNIAPIFTAEWWINLGKTCINGLIAGFEGGINGIIGAFESMINWIVDGLNKISFDIPDWVPGLGGKTFGFDIPEVSFDRVSIPRLAQGAVLPANKPFLAMVGDQKHGTNIEAPLQTIVDAFNIALSQNGGYNRSGNTEVVLEIDGREFGRAVLEQSKRENRRIGTRLVVTS